MKKPRRGNPSRPAPARVGSLTAPGPPTSAHSLPAGYCPALSLSARV
jgi:hypothetical protein